MFLFFFKQKTAYEMRISDCSSDVCSSDLGISSLRFDRRGHIPEFHRRRLCLGGALPWWQRTLLCRRKATLGQEGATGNDNCHPFHLEPPPRNLRSEEHTSELQSLMAQLVCRLLLETHKNNLNKSKHYITQHLTHYPTP